MYILCTGLLASRLASIVVAGKQTANGAPSRAALTTLRSSCVRACEKEFASNVESVKNSLRRRQQKQKQCVHQTCVYSNDRPYFLAFLAYSSGRWLTDWLTDCVCVCVNRFLDPTVTANRFTQTGALIRPTLCYITVRRKLELFLLVSKCASGSATADVYLCMCAREYASVCKLLLLL